MNSIYKLLLKSPISITAPLILASLFLNLLLFTIIYDSTDFYNVIFNAPPVLLIALLLLNMQSVIIKEEFNNPAHTIAPPSNPSPKENSLF